MCHLSVLPSTGSLPFCGVLLVSIRVVIKRTQCAHAHTGTGNGIVTLLANLERNVDTVDIQALPHEVGLAYHQEISTLVFWEEELWPRAVLVRSRLHGFLTSQTHWLQLYGS